MEKFNLERALAGEPLITRDNTEVTEIHFFKTCTKGYSIIAVIGGEKQGFYNDGSYWGDGNDHRLDLFMKPKVVEGWFNVYGNDNAIRISNVCYSSEEEAKSKAESCTYIKTIKITNEMK
jgi:hypothetical protein